MEKAGERKKRWKANHVNPITTIPVFALVRKLGPKLKGESFPRFCLQDQLDPEGPFLTRSGVTIGDCRDKIMM
jgi:hypothetical protein